MIVYAHLPVIANIFLTIAGFVQAEDRDLMLLQARKAIDRSLPYIEMQGITWIKERACVTCHQTTFLIWIHNEAYRRGFEIDRHKLEDWTNWALLRVLAGLDAESDQGADTLSQLLLGRDPTSPWFDKPSKWHARTADPFENITKHLLKAQTSDGFWGAGGQSDNPPELPTAWAILALAARSDFRNARFPEPETSVAVQRLVAPNDEAVSAACAKALTWLRSQDPKKTSHLTEAAVGRLLVERKYGQPEDAERCLQSLLDRQNADGGWSADVALRQPSDAFATGQALYALLSCSNAAENEKVAIERAVKFLATSQQGDGSWLVPTAAFHPSAGKRERDMATDEVYRYWGTAWATLGLLHILPVPDEVAAKE